MAKKRILIIDDLEIFREPISIALQTAGFKTTTAENGKEALKIVESNVQPFDLMIVDFSMPEMDGLEFVRRAACFGHKSLAPTLMLTDIADKDVVIIAMKLGVKDYILKSNFSLTVLLEKVNKYVSSEVVAEEAAAPFAPPSDAVRIR